MIWRCIGDHGEVGTRAPGVPIPCSPLGGADVPRAVKEAARRVAVDDREDQTDHGGVATGCKQTIP